MTRTNKKVRYSPQSKQPQLTQPSGLGKTCAPEAAEEMFRILEGRWKMAIVFHLFGGVDKKCRVMRFSELERAIPAISQKKRMGGSQIVRPHPRQNVGGARDARCYPVIGKAYDGAHRLRPTVTGSATRPITRSRVHPL